MGLHGPLHRQLYLCLCGQFTEGVQSVYPEPDYIHYTVIRVSVGLRRAFEICLNLFKSSAYSHNQFLSGVNWGGLHDTLHIGPKKKSRASRVIALATQIKDVHSRWMIVSSC
jgi:hypothetical protein